MATRSGKIRQTIRDYSEIQCGRDLARYILQNYSAIKTEIEAIDIIIALRHKEKPKAPKSVLRKCWTLMATDLKYGGHTDDELRYMAKIASKYIEIMDAALQNLGNSRDIALLKDFYLKGIPTIELSAKYNLDTTTIENRRSVALKHVGDLFEMGTTIDLIDLLTDVGYEGFEEENIEE